VNTVPRIIFIELIFFITYIIGRYVTMLHHTRQERLARDKHSSLLGAFVSYKESLVNIVPRTV
jgi:hypothetical protein